MVGGYMKAHTQRNQEAQLSLLEVKDGSPTSKAVINSSTSGWIGRRSNAGGGWNLDTFQRP